MVTNNRNDAKVIGVGMHKTGTKSLADALRALDYRVTGPFGVDDRNIARNAPRKALEILRHHDAAQDNPWPFLYREIDRAHPGSKFILTYRDPEAWIDSVVRHFGGKSTPMREWIYGVGDPRGNERRYVEVYNRHNEEVLDYFTGRSDAFMVMNIGEGEGWAELCSFLGTDQPARPFPHANSHRQRADAGGLKLRILRALTAR